MLSTNTIEKSLTHATNDKLRKEDIINELESIRARLNKDFVNDADKIKTYLALLDQLSEFELGRFLIKNKGGVSGYWTAYFIYGYNNVDITSPLERFILEKSPLILATRERFSIFQSLLLENIKSHSEVCSIPCGLMGDLLTLNLPEQVEEIRFIGIDLDAVTLNMAKELAQATKTRANCNFFQKNAWDLKMDNQFDVITSNGLNIYEKDDSKVIALYRGLYTALKAGGTLICSALTPPPTPENNMKTEWDMTKIDKDNLMTAHVLFKIILQATWSNFRTTATTTQQLKEAGFENVEIHWDSQRIFPSFTAHKPFNCRQ